MGLEGIFINNDNNLDSTIKNNEERQGDTADHRRAHDSRVWVKGYRLKVKGKVNTTNRPCEAVGVEEINGLVRNAKGLVYDCQMVRGTNENVTPRRHQHQSQIWLNHYQMLIHFWV